MALVSMGNQLSGGSNVQFPPANNKAVCRFQNTTGSPITVVRFWGKWEGGANLDRNIKAVIYSDSSGNPGALLAVSDEKVGQTALWNSIPFSTPVIIAPGAWIWFGVISNGVLLSPFCLSSGEIRYNANLYSSGPSASFGAATSAAFTYPMMLEGDDGTMRFGRASVDTDSGNYQPDREHAEPFVLGGTSSVAVNSISTYVKTTSATVKSKAAIFTDNGGLPGTKLGQSDEVTGATANSWLNLPFSSPCILSPGTYWLCFISNENLVTPTVPYGGKLRADGSDTEATAFSSPSSMAVGPSISVAPIGIDIYASYSAYAPVSAARPQVFVCT